jgi:DNA-binding transcriptional ArsR family regulator
MIVIHMANHYSPSLDDVFFALGDPTRRAILSRLGEGIASVTELAAPFPMALPSLLKHLRILERAGLVRSKKRGRTRTCALDPAALHEAESWLLDQRAIRESRSDRMSNDAEHLHQLRKNIHDDR